MNLTLGTLKELKTHLLNASLQTNTDWDSAIANLGLGVALRFEKHCNRKFLRTVDDLFETNADRTRLIVPRFPLEVVTRIEVRDTVSEGFIDQGTVNDVLFNMRQEAGLLEFAGYLGGSFSRLRVTYTGGFWFDQSDDSSGSLPAGAAARPGDLFLAWLLQCEWIWTNRDKLGVGLQEKPGEKSAQNLGELRFVPEVKATLDDYVRYAID